MISYLIAYRAAEPAPDTLRDVGGFVDALPLLQVVLAAPRSLMRLKMTHLLAEDVDLDPDGREEEGVLLAISVGPTRGISQSLRRLRVRISRRILIPEHALIGRPSALIPRADEILLDAAAVLLVALLFDPHFHPPIFRVGDVVLLLHMG